MTLLSRFTLRRHGTKNQHARLPATQVRALGTQSGEKVIILGAAGRDFFDFMNTWSKQSEVEVMAFTATQIPGIDKRHFPAELCHNDVNGNKYPNGLDIFPEDELEDVIARTGANTCVLAYSDLQYDTIQKLAARVNAAGCKFVQLPPHMTMVESTKPVVAVCASRTGVGKSQTSRYIARYFQSKGLKVAAIRHPMPYDQNLLSQRCQRYETESDMDKYKCTIEEREEYFGHIRDGTLLFAGVDYEMILHEAEKEADIILWDGGNNDCSFYKPDLYITLVDSLRPADQEHYYPGEINVRISDMILLSKVDPAKGLEQAAQHADALKHLLRPSTPVLYGGSTIKPEAPNMTEQEAANLVKGKKVLVIDDGPTLTHGGMAYGAGYVMAKQLGATEIVDPRPYAKGSLKKVFEKFTHLTNVLPAMGYGAEQTKDLEATIQATPCDAIVIGTPSDFTNVLDLNKVPYVMARYELEIVTEQHKKQFHTILDTFYDTAVKAGKTAKTKTA